MYLVIDNYDSFVHNLTRYFVMTGVKCRVVRNDAISLEQIRTLKPKAIILSPGPCTPKEAGICIGAVKAFCKNTPILGICLGHQAIGEAYGCKTSKAKEPLHGIATPISHDQKGIFKDIKTPMSVGRYHSLIVKDPEKHSLEVTSRAENGEVMAIQHTIDPVYGLQFHPESILTPKGLKLIENFKQIVQTYHEKN